MNKVFAFLILFGTFFSNGIHCQKERKKYKYFKPNYSMIHLKVSNDTIILPFDSVTYNNIRSVNYFVQHNIEYLSVFDKQSLSVNLYNLNSRSLVKKILLKKCFPDRKMNRKTTVFFKSLDSLYVISYFHLYRIDSSGVVKDSVLYENPSLSAYPSFECKAPPVFVDNFLFTRATPYLSINNNKQLKKWRILYRMDFAGSRIELEYGLPNVYFKEKFSYLFFESSYCYNSFDRKFIFSFPADTNIYVSDLGDSNSAYYGKSKFQVGEIEPLNSRDLRRTDKIEETFLLRDSYGPIYFDSSRQLYLRIAETKMSRRDYTRKTRRKNQSVIIFDKDFKIVGESRIGKDVALYCLFFTKEGAVYARTNVDNENALYFVRLTYSNFGTGDEHFGRR